MHGCHSLLLIPKDRLQHQFPRKRAWSALPLFARQASSSLLSSSTAALTSASPPGSASAGSILSLQHPHLQQQHSDPFNILPNTNNIYDSSAVYALPSSNDDQQQHQNFASPNQHLYHGRRQSDGDGQRSAHAFAHAPPASNERPDDIAATSYATQNHNLDQGEHNSFLPIGQNYDYFSDPTTSNNIKTHSRMAMLSSHGSPFSNLSSSLNSDVSSNLNSNHNTNVTMVDVDIDVVAATIIPSATPSTSDLANIYTDAHTRIRTHTHSLSATNHEYEDDGQAHPNSHSDSHLNEHEDEHEDEDEHESASASDSANNSNGWSCMYAGCMSQVLFESPAELRRHHREHEQRFFCRVARCVRSENFSASAVVNGKEKDKEKGDKDYSTGSPAAPAGRPRSSKAWFTSKKDRERHEAMHSPQVRCAWEGCGRVFSRLDNMKDHVRRIHGGTKRRRKNQAVLDEAGGNKVER